MSVCPFSRHSNKISDKVITKPLADMTNCENWTAVWVCQRNSHFAVKWRNFADKNDILSDMYLLQACFSKHNLSEERSENYAELSVMNKWKIGNVRWWSYAINRLFLSTSWFVIKIGLKQRIRYDWRDSYTLIHSKLIIHKIEFNMKERYKFGSHKA